MTPEPGPSEEALAMQPHETIEYILAEHQKHRAMCKALERLAAASEFDPARVAALADFIRFDLTLHVIDEEEDFFPLLRARCLPEDGIDAALDQMTMEHAEDKTLSTRVRDVLNACLIERKAPGDIEGGAEALRTFAHHEMRHMTLENAVLVPLARRRLTSDDLSALGARFAARRRRLSAPAANT